MAKTASARVWYRPEQLVLKITLVDSRPKIWRRVAVESGLTLHELHYVIQNVFDWQDAHLYAFLVTPDGKFTHAARRNAIRFEATSPDPLYEDLLDSRPAEATLLTNVFSESCKQILYEYDFGDGWEHLVQLEQRLPITESSSAATCLAGENGAPPEDCGGIWGYYELLAALRDPDHDRHSDATDYFASDYDPAKFYLEAADRRLKKLFKAAPQAKKARKPQRD